MTLSIKLFLFVEFHHFELNLLIELLWNLEVVRDLVSLSINFIIISINFVIN